MKIFYETGRTTYDPLYFLAKDIPIELVQYSIEHRLINKLDGNNLNNTNNTSN